MHLEEAPVQSKQAFHVYGADIKPGGTVFYVDDKKVCAAAGTSTGPTNIIITHSVYSKKPPSAGASGAHRVDYVRAWRR